MPVTNVSNVILPCSIPGHSTTNVNYLSNTYSGSVVSVAMIVPSTQSIQTMSTSFLLLVNSLVIYSMPLTQTMRDVSFFNNPLLSPSTQLIQSLIFFFVQFILLLFTTFMCEGFNIVQGFQVPGIQTGQTLVNNNITIPFTQSLYLQ